MQPKRCPKCHSTKIETISDNGIEFIKCNNCHYDESLYEVTPTEKSSQKAKGRYSPYKTGGGRRTQKK